VSADSISLDAAVDPCDQPPSQVLTHSLLASSPRHYDTYAENAPIPPSASYGNLPRSADALTISSQLPVGIPSANHLVAPKGLKNRTSAAQSLRHSTLSKSLTILLSSSSHYYRCWT
jgi:hypothetical protein